MKRLSIFSPTAVGLVLCVLSCRGAAQAATLSVGPTGTYPAPCAAMLAAHKGDTIQVDAAGSYNGDVCVIKADNLTIQGNNGRPHIDAAGNIAAGKAIWVFEGDNIVVENIEFSGAVDYSSNGAGIRFEGTNLTVRNCYFHDNQDGLLTNEDKIGTILIEYSEFAYNGKGDGESHNLYVNHADNFTFQHNYSHHSKIGHLLKSRARLNYILYNRLSDEASGTGSYEIDLPSGGTAYVIGNVIEQGPNSPNFTMLAYMEEANSKTNYPNPKHDLYVVNNTFVNDQTSLFSTFIKIDPSDAVPVVVSNNIFAGIGTIITQARARLNGNISGVDPQFNDPADYDYTLMPSSPAIAAGDFPGFGRTYALTPTQEYVHASCSMGRTDASLLDVGAHQFGNGQPVQCSSYTGTSGASPSLSLSQQTVVAGDAAQAMVTLSAAAPSAGLPVTLMSANPAVTETLTATVPAGQTTMTLTVPTTWVASSTPVNVFAYGAGNSISTPLTITPAAPNPVGFTQLTNNLITFNANLSGPAPVGGATLVLTSSDYTLLLPPATVTVPQGTLSGPFNVLVGQVTVVTPVTMTATWNGVSTSQTINVTPTSLNWLGVNPASVEGGKTSNLNISLNGVGIIGGLPVILTSSNPLVAPVPPVGVVPPGSNNVLIPCVTLPVTQVTSVTITASFNGVSFSQTLTVNP